MKLIDGKALLLKLRDPKRVTDMIPNCKKVNKQEILVNLGIDEAHTLRSLGINAPSPIQTQYNWTGELSPFAHQKTTAAFLTLHRRAFCFNEQGTGKTASAIWAADYLMNKGYIKRVLVICPLSIMQSAWGEDLATFAPHRTFSVLHGTPKQRRAELTSGSDFAIINYDGVKTIEEELTDEFDLIIVDEATHYKNVRTTRWKTLRGLMDPDTWLWMMTGTPAAQSPEDAYGLAKLVNENGVPQFFSAWKSKLMVQISQFQWQARPEAPTIVFDALQPAVRFTKEECLDLPPMVYVKRRVPLTRQQIKYYELLKKQLVMKIRGSEITGANAAIVMNKLLQISAGAVYSDDGSTLVFDIDHRYKVLKEVVDESSQKILIFVPFKHAIDVLTAKLRADGVTTEVIRGDVSASKRTDIFKQFQTTPNPRVLVIQPQSAAHGVTLTAANTVVWWGPTSSLETYLQANARVHRSGQTHKCTVVQLHGSVVEKRMYSLLDKRINVHSKIIDLYKELLD